MNNLSEIKIKITHVADGFSVRINCADSDAFAHAICELKNTVPPNCRTYDPTKKFWTITDSDCLDEWLYELRSAYSVVTNHTGAYKPPPAQSLASPFTTLHLLPSAPPEVVKAAYKALARVHHPDARGNSERMVAINLAYETLARGR